MMTLFHDKSPVLLIAGPTASGKTSMAVQLARNVGGEVISADSMQVYKGFTIGTAQPSAEELGGDVVYHMVACVEPDQVWSVADWLRATKEKIAEIQARGRIAIIAGGTGLYFKALTNGLFSGDGVGRNESLRQALDQIWANGGEDELREELRCVDTEASERIHPNDRLRIVRALEVFRSTGRSMSDQQAEARRAHKPLLAHRFVLTSAREQLYERIDTRVLEMMEEGFVEEVQALIEQGATRDWPAMRALGYLPIMQMLRGEITREQAIADTQQTSRRYAKQQMVLFRNWGGAFWLDTERGSKKNCSAIEKVLEFFPA